MKKRYFLRFCGILFAVGLLLAGCDISPISEKDNVETLVLTGTSNGKTLTIKIIQGGSSRAAYAPKTGDSYEIWLGSDLVSKGQITVNGSNWTFMPANDSPNKSTVNVTYTNGTISNLTVPGAGISNASVSANGSGSPSGGNNGTTNNNGDEKPVLTGTVTIDKTSPKVGDTLTATYSGNGSGTATWWWRRNTTLINDTNSDSYIVSPADEGTTLVVYVSFANQQGLVFSNATAAVPPDDRPDLTGTVTIDKAPAIGATITATYVGGNGSGTASWQWRRDDNLITGATGKSYIVLNADANKTFKAQVSFTGQKGSVFSAETIPVPDTRPYLTGTVTINNTSPKVGDTLTVNYSGGNGSGTATWQWLRDYYEPISGTDSKTYKVKAEDGGYTLTALVSFINQSGSLASEPTKEVFVPVTGITGISGATAIVGSKFELNRLADISPANATNKAITWSIVNNHTTAAGAIITEGKLEVTGAGIVYVRATIVNGTAVGTNFTKDFNITFLADDDIGFPPGTTSFDVSNAKQWAAAISLIKSDGAGDYDINVTGSFTLSGSTDYTFGHESDIDVNISGNQTITLTNKGNLFFINNGQRVVMTDLNLEGHSGNDNSLVNVIGVDSAFTMRGSASVSGNTAGHGGGVYVRNGTFTMEDNASISGNTADYGGGGVYVMDGTFTMNGGNASVSGNTANNGGGVYVDAGGKFYIVSGTVYGLDSSTRENFADDGAALYVGNNGTAEYGTFGAGDAWDGVGSLITTDDTIEVVNGSKTP